MTERLAFEIGVLVVIIAAAGWPFIRGWWGNRCPKCMGKLTVLTSDEMLAVMKSDDPAALSQMCGSVALRCRGRCKRCYSRVGLNGKREIFLTALDVEVKN